MTKILTFLLAATAASTFYCANMNAAAALTAAASVQNSTPARPGASSHTDTIKVFETSGTTQLDRPVSVSRVFAEGEIMAFAQASIGDSSLLTQCDVKSRWPDGSLKFAIVSFVVPKLTSKGSIVVSFSNQAAGNNTGYLQPADMLDSAYDFDATIRMVGATTQTVSARQMLQGGAIRYWLQGPIVTAVIIEDRSAARTYDKDFGDGSKALHPIYEAWFYPADHKVQVGYSVENAWVSSKSAQDTRDETYSVTLSAGSASPATVFTNPTFTHIGLSRWHKTFWIGGAPGSVRVDYNLAYLTSTKAIPNYDSSRVLSPSLISSRRSAWAHATQTLQGDAKGIGFYEKELAAAGADDWIGLDTTWDVIYLFSMDDVMRQAMIGNADLAGRIPWHFREADNHAGSGHWFDAPGTGHVPTLGRVVSVNSRQKVTLSEPTAPCDPSATPDIIQYGKVSDEGWETSRDHMPEVAYVPYLMTGQYYYLEELQYEAAFIVGWKNGCTSESYDRQGSLGLLRDSQVRGNAWGFRTLAMAAFISPDDTPEKAYFESKLNNTIKDWIAQHGIDASHPQGAVGAYKNGGASPLGYWWAGNSGFVQPPVLENGSVASATAPWEENFLILALGVARDFGYGTGPLLQFMSRPVFNELLNPPNMPWRVEAYRYATILTATNDWVQRWSDVNTYTPPASGWQIGQDVDQGRGFLALAATSFLYPYQVDGFTGVQAWNQIKSTKPEQANFSTVSPKMDILLRVSSKTTGPSAGSSSAAANDTDVGSEVGTRSKATASASDRRDMPTAQSGKNQSDARAVSVPAIPGWYDVPNATLQSACPPNTSAYDFSAFCNEVVRAWNGGIADTKRNRLIIWGGGHADYYGNEVYAFDLMALRMIRLNNPSPINTHAACVETLSDGTPNSRHTYGGLAYIASGDVLFSFGGSLNSCGFFSSATWTFNLSTLQWTSQDPHKGPTPQALPGVVAGYDPNTQLVFLDDTYSLFSYDYAKNTYTVLSSNAVLDYHMTGVIDPSRKLFIVFGGGSSKVGGLKVFNIAQGSKYAEQDLTSRVTGCDALLNAGSPGLAYDSERQLIVGWPNFGNTVYAFNPDTKTCSPLVFPSGPPDSAHTGGPSTSNGTFGRFQYFPRLKLFALVNDSNVNAFTLRLTAP